MDIAAWLEELGLGHYAEAFRANEIDEEILPALTAEDLKELGVAAVGHRRKLLRAIAKLHGAETGGGSTGAHSGTARSDDESEPDSVALAAAEGERRQVTVLFCDLCDYTGLSRALGAEEVHALLDRFFGRVDQIIIDHGGRIDKHIGDCAMAVFGAPIAHGNDAERAVRAALSIHRAMAKLSTELGRHVQVHSGVASGQVVASGTGSASHREYTVTGDSVNLASRLAEAAEPGEILVSDFVHRALSDKIVASSKALLNVKGLAEAVPAWQLQEIRGPGAHSMRFVGRRGELNQFRAILASCRETGIGQTIYVRGEAGIGKSSLVEQFQAAAREAGFACHAGAVFDFGTGIGRDAVRVLVRDLLEAGARVNEDALAAIERAIDAGLVDPADAIFLHDLLDLPPPQGLRARYDAMDNATRYRGKCRCASHLVARAARVQPRLLVVEDVHWADGLVLGYLAQLSATIGDCPALLVMTTRTEGDPLDRAWRTEAKGAPLLTLDLGPLRPEEARALAAESLAADGGTAERCLERAGGNPLFLQQLLLHAEESAESGVPGTIQSLVQARLDRLEPEDKAAVQAASILGQRFDPEALAHLLGKDHRPERLTSQLLVEPQGEGWTFAHALIRDAVYDTLLSHRRRGLHERAAMWFADSDPVLHAQHLERAEHPAAARGYAQAARSQMAQLRYQTARRLAERGLSLALERADRFVLSCLKGDILHDLGEMRLAREAYEAALAEASDEPERCQALIGLAAVKRISEDLDGALVDLEDAEAAAVAHDLIIERGRIHFLRGNLCFPRGEIDGCLREHGRSLELARQAGNVELEAAALGGLGDAEFARGRMRSACRRLQECIDLCRRQGYGRIEVANHAQLAHAKFYASTVAEAFSEARSAADAAAAVGHLRAELNARSAAIWTMAMRRDWQALREEAEKMGALIDRLGARRFSPLRLLHLGHAALHEGNRKEAVRHLEEALDVARETDIRFLGPTVLGGFALVVQEPEKKLRALKEAEAVIRAGCMGANQLRFYSNAMQVALDLGEWREVERFAQALEDFTAAEPLPWSTFFVARGRALAACASGSSATAIRDELERLLREGRRLELEVALPDLEKALGKAEAR